jgi:CitMHS family citrate-Mg2+:H+ or citrate-Ca2+:H+ symporter
MLGILGFLTMFIIIVLLFKSKVTPTIAFIIIPIVMAAIGGFSVTEIGDFVKSGVGSTASTATLFIFSITFFGLMSDVGMFDVLIDKLVKKAGTKVIAITILTAVIAMISHLDGAGASTFLITVPAMLPLYKKLNMRNTTLMLICTASMGVMNLLPWGGPTMRAATVLGIEASYLWHQLIPMQIAGIIACLAVAVIMGRQEIKLGAGANGVITLETEEEVKENTAKAELARPKLVWFNAALTIGVILVLSFVDMPTYIPFMIGVSIALIVNYPGMKNQEKRLKAHASAALTMAMTLLAAGVLLGVLDKSGMMESMANAMANVIPAFMGPYIHLIIGVASAPLALVFGTDSYYYGVLPIMIGIASSFGIDPIAVAITMVICRNCASFISPLVPATFLGCGLAEIEIKDHIRTSFWWVWGISIIMMIIGIFTGVLPL